MKNKKSKCQFQFLLFDNDGVLVDTEGLYFEAYQQALSEIGFHLTHALFHEHILKQATGVWHLLDVTEEEELAIRQRRNDLYAERIQQGGLLIDGVSDALEKLAPHFRMGIVTSSKREHFDLIHQSTNILHHFEFVLCAGDYDNYKPAPDPYLKGAELANVPIDKCLVLEDSQRGLMAAHAAGIPCWVIPRGLTEQSDFSLAERRFESLAEVVEELIDYSV